jgi:peptidyl-prolyl cis-trans isomerase B (cyclophilin B)
MEFPQLEVETYSGPVAKITTELGTIAVKLFAKEAPLAVENFIRLAQQGYYQDTIFHRVVQDFMIQGGDPEGTSDGGNSIWGHEFEDEISPRLFHFRGALAMANAGPNTNGSQFYIVTNHQLSTLFDQEIKSIGYPAEIVKKYQVGGTPWLDGHFTIFGQVTAGMSVVDQIAAGEVDTITARPLKPVKVKKIKIDE